MHSWKMMFEKRCKKAKRKNKKGRKQNTFYGVFKIPIFYRNFSGKDPITSLLGF